MKRIKADYKVYMEHMESKDFVITDAPWNLGDKPPKVARQLDYELWDDDITGMISIFQNVRTDLLFVWCINAIVQELFEALTVYNYTEPIRARRWRNKNKFCWIKLTHLGNYFHGTGHWNRNCSEELFIFARPTLKPIRLNMKSHFMEMRRPKTVKPPVFESLLIYQLWLAGLRKGAYIFSGTDSEKMALFESHKFNLDCVDIEFERGCYTDYWRSRRGK